ncbi:hypothetical protein [Hyella patelloides]|uniref:hypothetical protein n=1 Tax=Hyella patelloides TaxID=1982969 RepID=UPI00119CB9C0|nr:hypothetical protein [Hyella patelloides]
MQSRNKKRSLFTIQLPKNRILVATNILLEDVGKEFPQMQKSHNTIELFENPQKAISLKARRVAIASN